MAASVAWISARFGCSFASRSKFSRASGYRPAASACCPASAYRAACSSLSACVHAGCKQVNATNPTASAALNPFAREWKREVPGVGISAEFNGNPIIVKVYRRNEHPTHEYVSAGPQKKTPPRFVGTAESGVQPVETSER